MDEKEVNLRSMLLQLAHNYQDDPKMIVARAKEYLKFVKAK